MGTNKIILDTNFLLIPVQFRIDIFEGIKKAMDSSLQFFVLDKTLIELDNIIKGKIKKRKGRDKFAAKIGKALIHKKEIKILKTKEPKTTKKPEKTDNILLSLSQEGYIIATQDRILASKIKRKGNKVIIMRQKGHLIFK